MNLLYPYALSFLWQLIGCMNLFYPYVLSFLWQTKHLMIMHSGWRWIDTFNERNSQGDVTTLIENTKIYKVQT